MDGLRKLMEAPLPGETAASLDGSLSAEAAGVDRELKGVSGLVGLTQNALKEVADFLESNIEHQSWQRWAKLAKLKPGVKDDPKFTGLKAAGGQDGVTAFLIWRGLLCCL